MKRKPVSLSVLRDNISDVPVAVQCGSLAGAVDHCVVTVVVGVKLLLEPTAVLDLIQAASGAGIVRESCLFLSLGDELNSIGVAVCVDRVRRSLNLSIDTAVDYTERLEGNLDRLFLGNQPRFALLVLVPEVGKECWTNLRLAMSPQRKDHNTRIFRHNSQQTS